MGVSMQGGNGDKKDLNFELNLVPFIDLMSMCICFLLITAVWSQVSMIQIGASIYGKKSDSNQPEPVPEKELVNLRVDINDAGYTIFLGRQTLRVPKVNGAYDGDQLLSQLKDIKGRFGAKKDGTLSLVDSIKFEDLITGMDAMMLAGFIEISVATAGGE